jgi:hypothetical protein
MKNAVFPQQFIQGDLHQKGGFAYAGTGQKRPEIPRMKDIFGFIPHQFEWVTPDNGIFEHHEIPFPKIDDSGRG